MATSILEKNGIAEIELVYRAKPDAASRPIIRSAGDAYSVLRTGWNENKLDLIEEFKIMLLNQAKRLIGIVPISTGGITSTVVDPRICFVAALKASATSMILAHNHPSMNLAPSATDRETTSRMKEGGRILDIQVLDHLIICRNGYYSFADEDFTMTGYSAISTKPSA